VAPVRERLKPYQREAFQAARTEYEAAMAYSLDFPSSGLNLGNLYASLGEPATAERYFRLALSIDDLFFPAKMNLAVLLSGSGRNREAEELLQQVVRAYPGNGDAAYMLGLLQVEMGQPDAGAHELSRAVGLLPRNARARYNLGLLLQQLDRPGEAETMLKAALELEPESPDFLLALSDHYLRRGRPEPALALARRLQAAHPELPAGRQLEAAARQAIATRSQGGSPRGGR